MKFAVSGFAALMLWVGAFIVALAMIVHFDIPPLVFALYLIIMGLLGLTGH